MSRFTEDREAARQHAIQLCVDAGGLELCDICDSYYIATGEGIEDLLEATEDDEERAFIEEVYNDNAGSEICLSCDKSDRD